MIWYVTDFMKLALDDDLTDRLHHFFTAIILLLCLIASSKRQYIGSPINCFCPKHFTKAHIEYAENYCWTSNTYNVPIELKIPESIDDRKTAQIVYYQWVPCVLLIQIVLFQIPNLFWTHSYPKVGIQIQDVVESANIAGTVKPDERQKQVKVIGKHLMQSFLMREKLCGQSLCYLYIFVKFIYLINLLLQFALVFFFFNGEIPYSFLPNFLDEEIHTRRNHSHFPRTTLCDLVIRELGNLHRHTIQCILPINRINELIYQIIFVWFSFLLLATMFSLFRWLIRLTFFSMRFQMIADMTKSNLPLNANTRAASKQLLLQKFCDKFLRHDGMFIIYLLNHNASYLVASEITISLWRQYQSRKIQFRQTLLKRRQAITSSLHTFRSDEKEDHSSDDNKLSEYYHIVSHCDLEEEEHCL